MNLRRISVVIAVLVAGAICVFTYKRSTRPEPQAHDAPSVLTNASVQTVQPVEIPTQLRLPVACAQYIEKIEKSFPPERHTIHNMLPSLAAKLFISDYIMAAKVKGSDLPLSKAAIAEAFKYASTNSSALNQQLSYYSRYSDTLTEHYEMVRSRGNSLESVEAVLRDTGLPVNYESDLLTDCLRLAQMQTGARNMYGSKQGMLDEHEPFPEAAAACKQAFGQVFGYRFENRYGISQQTASNLVERLSTVTITNLNDLSPPDFDVPAVIN